LIAGQNRSLRQRWRLRDLMPGKFDLRKDLGDLYRPPCPSRSWWIEAKRRTNPL
jgi:hypothetical protein